MGLGRMALAFLIDCGGATYLAERMVQDQLDVGRLYRVADAPVIDRQVYAVSPVASERHGILEQALQYLAAPQAAKPAARATSGAVL